MEEELIPIAFLAFERSRLRRDCQKENVCIIFGEQYSTRSTVYFVQYILYSILYVNGCRDCIEDMQVCVSNSSTLNKIPDYI